MNSPKHLWSGDWQDESAPPAEPGGETGRTEEPIQAPDVSPPDPSPAPIARAADRSPRRLARVSREEVRGWVVAGLVAFVAAVLSAVVVTMIARGASPPSNAGAANATSPATRGSRLSPDRGWLGVEVRNGPTGGVVIDAVGRGAPAGV